MKSVSVLGLGVMGAALARSLIAAGYHVTVWNRTPEKAAPLVSDGATLAPSAKEAIATSDVAVICILSHSDTRLLLERAADIIAGKTIIELSTGEANDARALTEWIMEAGAHCLIGMISTFPGGIGKPESAIVTVGDKTVWDAHRDIVMTMAGSSSYLGPDVRALAALFAALFLPRQGFMFGMIYGALICEKSGISMDEYVRQIPLTLKVVHDYYDVFASTVPAGDFENPPASIGTYRAAFKDVLDTFKAAGVRHELPELLGSLVQNGVDAGLSDKQVTALIRLMAR